MGGWGEKKTIWGSGYNLEGRNWKYTIPIPYQFVWNQLLVEESVGFLLRKACCYKNSKRHEFLLLVKRSKEYGDTNCVWYSLLHITYINHLQAAAHIANTALLISFRKKKIKHMQNQ